LSHPRLVESGRAQRLNDEPGKDTMRIDFESVQRAAKAREKMKTYTVNVEQTETKALWVEVRASHADEAEKKAIESCKQGKEFFRGDVYDRQFTVVGIEEGSS
jgi:hypothetical protein